MLRSHTRFRATNSPTYIALASWLVTAALVPAVARANTPIKLVLGADSATAGKAGAAVRGAMQQASFHAALAEALKKTGKFTLIADACDHHDLEVAVFAASEQFAEEAPSHVAFTLVVLQVGTPVDAAFVLYDPLGTKATGKEAVSRAPQALANALSQARILPVLQRPPEGAASGRGLACRVRQLGQPFAEAKPSRDEAKALAECKGNDGQACYDAGLLVRARGQKINDAKVGCEEANKHLEAACGQGYGEACFSWGQNLARCGKPGADAYRKAVELGVFQACAPALGRVATTASAVAEACEALAARGLPNAADLHTLACAQGVGAACARMAALFEGGGNVAPSAETASVLHARACGAGATASCAQALQPLKPAPTPPPPTPTVARKPPVVRPPVKPSRKFFADPFAMAMFGLGIERMAPPRGDSGYGLSMLASVLYATSRTGLGMDFDLGLGYAGSSGLMFDLRYGVGPALWLGRHVMLMPMVGIGVGGVGLEQDTSPSRVVAELGFSAFAGGHVLIAKRGRRGQGVALDLKGSTAWVHSRSREDRLAGRVQLGAFILGAEWRRYTNNGSQLTFTLGTGLMN